MENTDKLLLVGCGILKNEINYIISKNDWAVDTVFINSSLHVNFKALSKGLTAVLQQYSDRNTVVFYGECHPLMDKILQDHHTFRTPGQNCVEMLLGTERYMEELNNGAFFLFEDWALHWEQTIRKTFGNNQQMIKDIFHEDRKYILGIKTPCSGEFELQAMDVAKEVDLPLRWNSVSLEHLESVLLNTFYRKTEDR
ncbi:DUF1638 domain-containing protein [Acetobacterium sp.]|uniref:DUF1638 domain-containing protein n=1 Tax=Acetobacterium sp. TaxID=1872094 RepID=UPI002F40CDC4